MTFQDIPTILLVLAYTAICALLFYFWFDSALCEKARKQAQRSSYLETEIKANHEYYLVNHKYYLAQINKQEENLQKFIAKSNENMENARQYLQKWDRSIEFNDLLLKTNIELVEAQKKHNKLIQKLLEPAPVTSTQNRKK